MSDAIVLEFGGQNVAFFLDMNQLMIAERECGDKSIVTMFEEMRQGTGQTDEGETVFVGVGPVRIKDVYEVIRCAAIGGGMSANDAKTLVKDYVDGRPFTETVPVAWAILDHTIMRVQLKKKGGDAESPSPLTEAS